MQRQKSKLEREIKKLKVTGQYQCAHCDVTPLKSALALATHIGKTHPKESLKQCTHCGQRFVRPAMLKAHIKEKHSQPAREEFICHICKQQCENSLGLKIHIGMVHQQLAKPYDPNFDFTTASEFPSWKAIKEDRTKNIDYNSAGFLKMIGKNLEDPRQKPQNVNFKINKDEILNQWKHRNMCYMWSPNHQSR